LIKSRYYVNGSIVEARQQDTWHELNDMCRTGTDVELEYMRKSHITTTGRDAD